MHVAKGKVGTRAKSVRIYGWLLVVNPIFEREKVIMEQDLICKKCGLIVGKLDADAVVLTIGDNEFYQSVTFSHRCGRAIRFKPNEPKNLHSLKGVAQNILNALGKDRKVRGN
jgi:hypothetical protein